MYLSSIGLLYINWAGELAPYERMKVSPKVHKKTGLGPPWPCTWGKLCSWRWVQAVFRGAIVYREGVVTGGPQIVGTPYHGGALSLEYGFQNLQVLVDGGIPRLPNNPTPQGQQRCPQLLP
jgi:hypothetical protein